MAKSTTALPLWSMWSRAGPQRIAAIGFTYSSAHIERHRISRGSVGLSDIPSLKTEIICWMNKSVQLFTLCPRNPIGISFVHARGKDLIRLRFPLSGGILPKSPKHEDVRQMIAKR